MPDEIYHELAEALDRILIALAHHLHAEHEIEQDNDDQQPCNDECHEIPPERRPHGRGRDVALF